MAKTGKKTRLVSSAKIECVRCKERKDLDEFSSPQRAIYCYAEFNIPLSPPDENKPSQPILLCSACHEILNVNRQLKNRLSGNIKAGIYKSFRTGKGGLWESHVGYTLAELRQHLHNQFKPGMSWANYGANDGRWQIDHTKPVSSFDFSSYDDKDFKRCWSLSNLRPLWARENWTRRKNRELMRRCFDESPYASCLDCPQTVHIKYHGRFCQRFRRWVPEWWETLDQFSGKGSGP